jgi:hypothetical protein
LPARDRHLEPKRDNDGGERRVHVGERHHLRDLAGRQREEEAQHGTGIGGSNRNPAPPDSPPPGCPACLEHDERNQQAEARQAPQRDELQPRQALVGGDLGEQISHAEHDAAEDD